MKEYEFHVSVLCGSWYMFMHVKFYNYWIWNSRSDWRLLERPYTTCLIYCHLLSVLCRSHRASMWFGFVSNLGIKVICCWVFQESQLGDHLITYQYLICLCIFAFLDVYTVYVSWYSKCQFCLYGWDLGVCVCLCISSYTTGAIHVD